MHTALFHAATRELNAQHDGLVHAMGGPEDWVKFEPFFDCLHVDLEPSKDPVYTHGLYHPREHIALDISVHHRTPEHVTFSLRLEDKRGDGDQIQCGWTVRQHWPFEGCTQLYTHEIKGDGSPYMRNLFTIARGSQHFYGSWAVWSLARAFALKRTDLQHGLSILRVTDLTAGNQGPVVTRAVR